MYLLTNCASCAAPLSLAAPKCVRCKTRYCDASCQRDHWRRHKKDCEAMGRERITAETRYVKDERSKAEQLVPKLADEDAARLGWTCYMCHETRSKYGEGLTRGCSCTGTTGFAHVTCVMTQATLGTASTWVKTSKGPDEWTQRNTCRLCGQEYHGAVRCALGWHCWFINKGRKEGDEYIYRAMLELGIGLVAASRHEEAFGVLETLYRDARVSDTRFHYKIMILLAKVCNKLGRESDAFTISESMASALALVPGKPRLSGLTMMRALFSGDNDEREELTHRCALELGVCMLDQNLVAEAWAHLTKSYHPAIRALGTHAMVYEFVWRTAQAAHKLHFFGGDRYRAYLIRSIEAHVKVLVWATNTLGIVHPTTLEMWASLKLCFEEQLDWTLDDIPRNQIELLDEIPRPPGHKVFWK